MQLKKGDIVTVIAPSRYIGDFNDLVNRGILALENMGLIVKTGKFIHEKNANSSGTVTQRVADLNDAIRNDKVKAIFCALGGDSANDLLEHIDYEFLKENPKIIMGFSDATHLLLAIQKKSSLVTIHGPNVKDIGAASADGLLALENFIFGRQELVSYGEGIEIVKKGKAEGVLIGGNLFVINALTGSEFMPDLTGAVLFIEDIDEGISSIRFQLQQLRLTGAFSKIAGIVVGHVVGDESLSHTELSELLLEITNGFSFPIIHVEYFGHGLETFYPLPVGVRASIDTDKRIFSLSEKTFLE